ncbi:hypothetical protein NHX12_003551 [Muraenolepis orangiensis]|uniref:Uncharacterized protein n=1 Tax=Muraenolepis orangiensis TaxID=630683 RepID=A0A9Q0E0M1_9TELE|nr:hypothetical protein NHX12_003551 [Muraenolepis orangiensis]
MPPRQRLSEAKEPHGGPFQGALLACYLTENPSRGPCQPATSQRTPPGGPAGLLPHGGPLQGALLACYLIEDPSREPCWPATSWRTSPGGPAGLLPHGGPLQGACYLMATEVLNHLKPSVSIAEGVKAGDT